MLALTFILCLVDTTFHLVFLSKFLNKRPPQAQSSSLESIMRDFMARTNTTIQCLTSTVRNLKSQMGQLANELKNRPQRTLPSDIENPKVCSEGTLQSLHFKKWKSTEKC